MKIALTEEELKKLTKRELYEIAKKLKIRGRGRMRKAQLLEAVKRELLIAKEMVAPPPPASRIEEAEPPPLQEEREELPLPESYPVYFLGLIPVNPKLLFIYWNAGGRRGTLKLIVEGRDFKELQVEPGQRELFLELEEELPFKRVKAVLITEEEALTSNEVVMPAREVVIGEEAAAELTELITKQKPELQRGGPYGEGR